jgi:hypothetical protein
LKCELGGVLGLLDGGFVVVVADYERGENGFGPDGRQDVPISAVDVGVDDPGFVVLVAAQRERLEDSLQ